MPENVLEQSRIYVTCQNDDDLPYVLKYAGDHNIVIGTDYGHFDPSTELDAISVFKEKSGLDQARMDAILCHNPAALYGL